MRTNARIFLPPLLALAALAAPLPAQTPEVQQQTSARLNWKRAFEKDPPEPAETKHLLIFGTVPGKTLKEVGEALEAHFELAHKALEMDDKRDMWKGKLTVFLIPEKADYDKFIRRVERRYPEEGEHGSAVVRSDEPHVVAGPPRAADGPPADAHAGEQVAIALMIKKVNADLPFWVRSGFGRATAMQAATPEKRAQEYRKALGYIQVKKRTAADAWGGRLETAEAPVVRGTVLAYLAYSGRTAKFVPFLMAFRPTEERPEPTTADALKSVEVAPDRLHNLWLAWLRTAR